MPHLEQLVEKVHESSSVCVLDGDEVVYVARVPTKRIMRVAISVGTRFPAYATSMGRILLAAQGDEWRAAPTPPRLPPRSRAVRGWLAGRQRLRELAQHLVLVGEIVPVLR